MPDDPLADAVESFSLPIEHFIAALGRGIAEAQRALDENSILTQQQLDGDPKFSPYGLQATWYQFPKVDLELKLAITISQQQSSSPSPSPAPGEAPPPAPAAAISSAALVAASRVTLVAQPVSASYQTQFNYDANACSTLTLSIVPVPPGAVPPRMTRQDVQKAALAPASGAKFKLDGQGNPVANLRFDINFNAAARTWYVLQYDPSNPTNNPVVAAVDDATGNAWAITKP